MALITDVQVVGPPEEIVVAALDHVGGLQDELDVLAFWGKLRYVLLSCNGINHFFALFRFRRTPISWLEWGDDGVTPRNGYRYGVRLFPTSLAAEIGYPGGAILDGREAFNLIDEIRARGIVIWAS